MSVFQILFPQLCRRIFFQTILGWLVLIHVFWATLPTFTFLYHNVISSIPLHMITHLTFTWPNSAVGTLEKDVKYVQCLQ